MNKILLNLLVVGVSVSCIQGASGMEIEGDAQSNYKKMLRSNSAKNKENINNIHINNFNAVTPKKSKTKLIKPAQFKLPTNRALLSELDSVRENPYMRNVYSPFSTEREIQGIDLNAGITIDLVELDYLITTFRNNAGY